MVLRPQSPMPRMQRYLLRSLGEVREITAEWLERYNEIRPHDVLESLPPAWSRE